MSTGSDSQTITFTTSEQDYSPANVSDIYGTMVFDERVMKELSLIHISEPTRP